MHDVKVPRVCLSSFCAADPAPLSRTLVQRLSSSVQGGMGALNAAMSLPAGLPVAPGTESEQARYEQALLGAMGRPSAPYLPPSPVTSVDWRKFAVGTLCILTFPGARVKSTCLLYLLLSCNQFCISFT
jgi:hypothetical protein